MPPLIGWRPAMNWSVPANARTRLWLRRLMNILDVRTAGAGVVVNSPAQTRYSRCSPVIRLGTQLASTVRNLCNHSNTNGVPVKHVGGLWIRSVVTTAR